MMRVPTPALRLALLLAAALAWGVAAAPALATGAGDDPAATEEHAESGPAYCAAAARQCGLDCAGSTEPGSAAASACQARCAIERAACDARDSLSGVQPWLSDKADRMDRFMEGFHGNDGEGYRTAPGLGDGEGGGDGDGDGDSDRADVPRSCGSAHAACERWCATEHEGDDYGLAGCESVCALDRATCEANAGVEAAKPFIEREAERLRDFFDGFLGEDETAPPPPRWGEENPDGTLDL
jgi:hypothetical protein